MPKIAFVGSCLSASITDALLTQAEDFSLIAWLSHVRSDVFCHLFQKNNSVKRLPLVEMNELFTELGADNANKKNNSRADKQSEERLKRFEKALQHLDILLIDTNYDLSLTVYDLKDEGKTDLMGLSLVPDKININNRLLPKPPIPIGQIVTNISQMVKIARAQNPALHIVLINFPTSGFDPEKRAERIRRSKKLDRSLMDAKLELQFIPALIVPRKDILPKGEHYFTEPIYSVYAKAILSAYQTKSWPQIGLNSNISALNQTDQKSGGGAGPNSKVSKAEKKGSGTPYDDLPERNFWRKAVVDKFPLSVSELYDRKFLISAEDAIATCGSCFAQHIGRRLRSEGFNVLDVERPPADLAAIEHVSRGYGIYSARYGNVYTARQLLQMFDLAFSDDVTTETWELDGRYFDPFRPNIDPEGFASPEEVSERRVQHLNKVREMFEQLTVFVFTLGLTEAWRSKSTGAVYPLCPGASVGHFDSTQYEFVNFSYEEVKADLTSFWMKLRKINPKAKMILTVSPVPLTATAENRHVLISTTYSKSVLRAVAGSMADENDDVDYFGSYEVITAPNFRGMFYAQNMRSILPEGVDFVMSHFFAQHTLSDTRMPLVEDNNDQEDMCDEILLDVSKREVRE